MPRIRPRQRQRLPVVGRVLLSASFVSNVGSGLTLPFLLIYLHQVRHIGLGACGLLIGGLAVIGLPVAAATGVLVDRLGPRTIAMVALGLSALGTASLVFVHSTASAFIPMALYGLGSGMAWPAWFALLSVVIRDERARPRLFALNFQLLNLGLGAGAFIAGLVVHVADPRSFSYIYLGDAVTTMVVVVALAFLPDRAFAVEAASPAGSAPSPAEARRSRRGSRSGGYRQVLADRRMRRFLVSTTLLALASYGAVDAGLVGFATTVVRVTPRTISLAFAANTAFIVVAQPLALRVVQHIRRTTALSIVAAFFAASWVMLSVAALWPRSLLGDVLTIMMFVIFGAGEILLSPVQSPLVNEFASDELRGRYNAASTAVFSLASVISPAVAGVMLGAKLGPEYLGLLVACCVASVFGFGWLRRALSDREDHEPAGDGDFEPASTT
jgi:MFS family permease